MPYTKQTWTNLPSTTTPISAARLSYMEDGIEDAYALAEAATASMSVTSQAGTSYTFVLGDANDYVRFTSGSAVAATVPPNSSVAFPVGTQITVEQAGAGAVTLTPGSGVTLNVHTDFTLVTDGQYSVVSLVKTATDTWTVFGKLA